MDEDNWNNQEKDGGISYNRVLTNMCRRRCFFISQIRVIAGLNCWAQTAQSVYRLATDWTVRGSNAGGSEIFRTRPGRSWGPPSLLYGVCRLFPGGKAAGVWRRSSTTIDRLGNVNTLRTGL